MIERMFDTLDAHRQQGSEVDDVGEKSESAASERDSPGLVRRYQKLEDLLEDIRETPTDNLSDAELVAVAETHERLHRRLSALGYRRIMDVADRVAQRSPEGGGGAGHR